MSLHAGSTLGNGCLPRLDMTAAELAVEKNLQAAAAAGGATVRRRRGHGREGRDRPEEEATHESPKVERTETCPDALRGEGGLGVRGGMRGRARGSFRADRIGESPPLA